MNYPDLLLGTAMWGDKVYTSQAFELLTYFYEMGYRRVDTATNYPINKNPKDFRAAERVIKTWIKAHGVYDLRIICKIGSINNLFTSEHNLSKSFILMNAEMYLDFFQENAATLMLHWDNRSDENAIRESYEALAIAQQMGWNLGLSGIKNPNVHKDVNATFDFDFLIEMKHNPFEHSLAHYAPFHSSKRRFIAYGTTGGGIKLDENYTSDSSLVLRNKLNILNKENIKKVKTILEKINKNTTRKRINEMYQLGLIYAYYEQQMNGIILGCSNLEQLQNSMSFYAYLSEQDYTDVFTNLKNI